jgi:hypothetical protein
LGVRVHRPCTLVQTELARRRGDVPKRKASNFDEILTDMNIETYGDLILPACMGWPFPEPDRHTTVCESRRVSR